VIVCLVSVGFVSLCVVCACATANLFQGRQIRIGCLCDGRVATRVTEAQSRVIDLDAPSIKGDRTPE
jgi:hypothetical protein